MQLYRGAEGSIRSISCHTSEPVVAACGLDRFVRIYNIDSQQLLQKVRHSLASFYLSCSILRFLYEDDSYVLLFFIIYCVSLYCVCAVSVV